MNKQIRKVCWMLILILGISTFGSLNTVYAVNMVAVPIEVKYGQTEARSIFYMINEMRTSSMDAWYWNESNTEKVNCLGLQELVYNYDLERVAMKRAAEIALSYGHTRPNGESCFSAQDEEGVYSMASGENIAYGYSSAMGVNMAWREDDEGFGGQGHRRNMLGEEFNSVGIGHVYYNGTHYWVEEFGNTQNFGSQIGANDSETYVNVSVAEQNILGYSLGAVESYNSKLNCGQSVILPKYALKIKMVGNGGYGNGCPIDTEVSYSLIPTDIATLQGNVLSVSGQGSVEVIVCAGGYQENLIYQVSHMEEILPAKAATKNQTGLTEGSICSGCGEILVAQKVIPRIESTSNMDAGTTKYKMNKTSASLKKGKTLTLKVTGSKGNVRWSSSNKNVATVNSKGVVTAKKKGNATIKAYCAALDKTVTCKVQVYEKYSQDNISKKILKLKSSYKEGKSWTNANYYHWEAIHCNCYVCIAFVGKVSDKVFGKGAKVTRHTSFSKIKAGDHIRIGNYHSVLVISKSGNNLTVVEGNYNSSIHWGRVITKSELQQEGFYVETRY